MDSEMKVPAKRPRWIALLYSAVFLIVAALAIDGIFGAHGLVTTYRMKLQARRAEQNIRKLSRENQDLANQVRQLKSDPTAIEREAREHMGLVKPGDLVFKLPDKKSSLQGAPSAKPGPAGSAPPSAAVAPPVTPHR